METEKLNEVKEKLRSYRDLYGNKVIDFEDIDSAKNVADIGIILDNHMTHVEECAKDVVSGISRFKESLGIFNQ